MRTTTRTGRVVGGLLFPQLAGLIVPFVLLLPLTTGSDQWLANAAASTGQIKLAVVLLLANCLLTVGITIALFPVVRAHSEALALWLLTVSVIMLLLQAIDNAHVLSMLSLSGRYAGADGSDELYRALAAALGSTRRWTHLSGLVFIDGWFLLLYAALYRFALVPRPLAAFGMLTVLLHFAGVPLRSFLGYGVVTPLGMSLAVSHVALASWLSVRGLREGATAPAPR